MPDGIIVIEWVTAIVEISIGIGKVYIHNSYNELWYVQTVGRIVENVVETYSKCTIFIC